MDSFVKGILRFRRASKIRTKPLVKPDSPQDSSKPSVPSLIIRHQSSSSFSDLSKPPPHPSSSTTSSFPKTQFPSLKLIRPAAVPAAPASPSPPTDSQPHSNRTILKLSTKSLASLKKQSAAQQQQQQHQGGTTSASPVTIATATEITTMSSNPETTVDAAGQANVGDISATSPTTQLKIPKLKLRVGNFTSSSAASTPTSAGQGLKRKSKSP